MHAEDGSLFFASEIKALVEAGAVTPRLNRSAMPEYLASRAPMGTDTMFEGVHRLAPGHSLLWRDGVVNIQCYWDLSFAQAGSTSRSESSWTAEFAERFKESVRLRLMSDVPFGMFLSGGIDSAAITATMAPLIDSPVKTFSVAFAEREANELAYARMVAERYATDHHEVVLTADEFFTRLPRLIWHEDEPIAHASSIPLHAVSMLAAQHVKVVLTGEGSDETLAGYPWYRATVINMGLGRRYSGAVPSGLQSGIRHAIEHLPLARSFRAKLKRTFLYLPPDLDTILYDNFGVFSRKWQRELLSPAMQAEVGGLDPYAAIHAAAARSDSATMLGTLLYTDIKTYLHELLMKQDQMSMAASIESRVPFLDHPLMEFVATMPDSMKIRGLTTKHVLRRAMRDQLPAPILSRRKMGFPTPLRGWLREEHTSLLDHTVLHPRAMRGASSIPTASGGWCTITAPGRQPHGAAVVAGEPRAVAPDLHRRGGCQPGPASGHGGLMRILWLKTELLHPVDRGGRIRTYAMLKALRRQHHITYAALDNGAVPDARALATGVCARGGHLPVRSAVAEVVRVRPRRAAEPRVSPALHGVALPLGTDARNGWPMRTRAAGTTSSSAISCSLPATCPRPDTPRWCSSSTTSRRRSGSGLVRARGAGGGSTWNCSGNGSPATRRHSVWGWTRW